jgi:hypothetical protein
MAAPTSSQTEMRVVGPRSSYRALPRKNPGKVEFRLSGSSSVLLGTLSIGKVEFMIELPRLRQPGNESSNQNYMHRLWDIDWSEIAGSKNDSGKWERLTGKVVEGSNTRGQQEAAERPRACGMVSPGRSQRQKRGCLQCALLFPVCPREVSAVGGLPCLEQTVDPGGFLKRFQPCDELEKISAAKPLTR